MIHVTLYLNLKMTNFQGKCIWDHPKKFLKLSSYLFFRVMCPQNCAKVTKYRSLVTFCVFMQNNHINTLNDNDPKN